MSFDLVDFFGYIDLPEGVNLLRGAFDLLNSLEYYEHIEPLEDLLSVCDDYDASTNRLQVTEVLETHLLRQLEFRGVEFEQGLTLGLDFLYELLRALSLIEDSDDPHFFQDQVFCIDTLSDKEKMIELVLLVSDLDRLALEERIVFVSEDYMVALSGTPLSTLPVDDTAKTLTRERQWLSPSLAPESPVRMFIEQAGHQTYPLSTALLVLFEDLQAIADDEVLADSLIALVLNSNVFNDEASQVYNLLEKIEPDTHRQASVGRYIDNFFKQGVTL